MEPSSTYCPRILVCPLDWGIGHASRCVPLIRELVSRGAEVIIAADNRPLFFLQKEFPELETLRFPGFRVQYPESGNMVLKMALSLPSILMNVVRENFALKKLIRQHKIDAVISDNRFGLWNAEIPCIFITHQLEIQSPLLGRLINSINRSIIDRYKECWIPDFPGEKRLSGILSQVPHMSHKHSFIGILSRFKKPAQRGFKKYKITAIISGPEPQRTIFENLIISALRKQTFSSAVLLGKTEEKEHPVFHENLTVFPHLSSADFQEIIDASELIICRSGYSTIMDMARLEKKVIFIPTPGQTEQEYLAKYISGKGMGLFYRQADFNLDKILSMPLPSHSLTGGTEELLSGKITSFLAGLEHSRS